MKFTSLMCALAAGMAMSAAASAEPGARQAGGGVSAEAVRAERKAPAHTSADVGDDQVVVARRRGQDQNEPVLRGPGDVIIYDTAGACGAITRIVNNVTDLQSPSAIFDDGFFFPATGGATVNQINMVVWPTDGVARPEIFVRITVWDTIIPADPIVQNTQIFTEEYLITGAGANTGGISLIAFPTGGANQLVIPDDDWGIEIAFIDAFGGNILPEGTITSAFPAASCGLTMPIVGDNAAIFWIDGDFYPPALNQPWGDGIRYEPFDPDTGDGDAFAFGAGGPLNALRMTMFGVPNVPPAPTGACCIAGACVIRTEADCMTEGGTYEGDATDCTGSFAYTASSQPFVAIPDNDLNGVSDSIVVAAGSVITDLDVGLVISHTWQGDLKVTLTHVPSNTTVTLVDRPGTTGVGDGFGTDNFGNTDTNAPFILDDAAEFVYDTPVVARNNPVGRWKPDLGPLSAFNGINSTGTWTLTVSDAVALDTGFIFEWGIAVNTPNDTCPAGPAFCDADWCQDGNRDVPDIFCFLADWFALDNAARTYGGAATPVQAIFAWLAVWFATPNGSCPP